MSGDCGARLVGDQDLRCDRNAPHYNKKHRASDWWMTNDARMIEVTVTWDVGSDEWTEEDVQ